MMKLIQKLKSYYSSVISRGIIIVCAVMKGVATNNTNKHFYFEKECIRFRWKLQSALFITRSLNTVLK